MHVSLQKLLQRSAWPLIHSRMKFRVICVSFLFVPFSFPAPLLCYSIVHFASLFLSFGMNPRYKVEVYKLSLPSQSFLSALPPALFTSSRSQCSLWYVCIFFSSSTFLPQQWLSWEKNLQSGSILETTDSLLKHSSMSKCITVPGGTLACVWKVGGITEGFPAAPLRWSSYYSAVLAWGRKQIHVKMSAPPKSPLPY